MGSSFPKLVLWFLSATVASQVTVSAVIWYPAKVGTSHLIGSTFDLPAANELSCAMKATKMANFNLWCYENERCSLYDQEVLPFTDHSGIDTIVHCMTSTPVGNSSYDFSYSSTSILTSTANTDTTPLVTTITTSTFISATSPTTLTTSEASTTLPETTPTMSLTTSEASTTLPETTPTMPLTTSEAATTLQETTPTMTLTTSLIATTLPDTTIESTTETLTTTESIAATTSSTTESTTATTTTVSEITSTTIQSDTTIPDTTTTTVTTTSTTPTSATSSTTSTILTTTGAIQDLCTEVENVGCIHLVDTESTWDEAKAGCESLGGHLYNADTEQQFLDLVFYIRAQYYPMYFWLGIKNRIWTLTSRPVSVNEWYFTEPNGNADYCGYMNKEMDYYLADYVCSDPVPYLCQS